MSLACLGVSVEIQGDRARPPRAVQPRGVPDCRDERANRFNTNVMLAALLDLSVDAIITVDEQTLIVQFNRGAEKIFGWSASEVIGKPLSLLVPQRLRGVHGEHVKHFAASGDGARLMGARRPILGCRRNGEEFPAEASISSATKDGRTYFGVVLRDITEREREAASQRYLTEATALLASSLEYEQTLRRVATLAVPILGDLCVLDMVEDGALRMLALVDVDAESERMAREMRRAYMPALGSNHPIAQVQQSSKPILWPVITEDMLRAASTDEEHLELAVRMKSRSALFVPLAARGRVLGVLSCWSRTRQLGAEDLVLATELARRAGLAVDHSRMYADAQRASRERDEVLAVVSHDLRNPISTIAMCASALQDPVPPGTEDVRSMAEIIQHSADWAQRIIRDLLDATSIEAGRLSLDRKPAPAADILAATREIFLPHAQSGDIELLVECDADLPLMDVDRERVMQVLFNLLGNALKFTPAGGRVIVHAALDQTGTAIRISVTDTGHGIPADQLPHVFDRYWQLHRTRRGGAGLGLAIVKGIVAAHGGEVQVASTEGVGSTFTFMLPAAARVPVGSP